MTIETEKKDLIFAEHSTLREELHNLKKCQITFFSLSISATGLLFGLASKIGTKPETSGLLFLAPLVVVIPCWWIFFDKATTITRIVGYFRVLECIILGNHSHGKFVGWENALEEFRKKQRELHTPKVDIGNIKSFLNLFTLRTSHPYWVITWSTFFCLCFLCLVLSKHCGVNNLFFFFSLFIVILSSIFNGRIVWQLIYGRNSYMANQYIWLQIIN